MRYFLDITYRGTRFHGWQIQPNGETVQEKVEEALSTILRTATPIVGSGRTDAGVHATQQIAHFDAKLPCSEQDFAHKLNAFLTADISVNHIRKVVPEANARFDAQARTYFYHIHQQKDPFQVGRSYHFNPKLNMDLMQDACEIIKRWQNFESFSKVHTEVNHFDCKVYEAFWEVDNRYLTFKVKANRFLRGMVRTMVGTLLEVGLEKLSIEAFKEVLAKRDRRGAGRSVPPEGLFLTAVDYPSHIYL